MARLCVGEEHLEVAENSSVELKYYVLEQKRYFDELEKEIITYGVEIEKINNEVIENNKVENVTCNEEEIDSITRILKDNKVLPIHLQDVILDMLS